jgi:hypothetical protein
MLVTHSKRACIFDDKDLTLDLSSVYKKVHELDNFGLVCFYYDEMNLQFATQKICAPSHAVEIDLSKDINYYETLCLYCAENDVNLDGVNDVEFEADADQIQHFSLGEDGIVNERFWFWVETNNFEYEEQVL